MGNLHIALLIALATICATLPTSGQGAVPADTIKRWQDRATDVAEITVLSIEKHATTLPWREKAAEHGAIEATHVTLIAKVLEVRRSNSGMARNAVIVLRYQIQRTTPADLPNPDGSYGTMLEIGDRALAHMTSVGEANYALSGDAGCLAKLP